MNLLDLKTAVEQAITRAEAAGVPLRAVGVLVNTPQDHGLELARVALFENDDEETYRQHLRCGGQRELNLIIELEGP